MTPDELNKLRPSGGSVDAVKKSLAEIERHKQATEAQRAAKIADEPKLLLTASPKQISEFNAQIAELDFTIRQLTALAEDVLPELAPAQRRELLAGVTARHVAAADLTAALRVFAFERYPVLCAEIIAAAELERQHAAAIWQCRQEARGSGLNPAELAALPAIGEVFATESGQGFNRSLSLPALLPLDGADQTPMPYWKPTILDQQPGGAGKISAAELAKRHAPTVVQMGRRMTEDEIAAARPPGNIMGGEQFNRHA